MNKTETQIEQTTLSKENYYNECLNWSRDYLLSKREHYFNSDQLRQQYRLECEDTIPREPRVFGAVIRQLVKENIIIFATTQMIKPIFANHRRQTIWRTVN
jgi:hypothetical protein